MKLNIPDFNLIVIHEPGVENYERVRNYIKNILGSKVVYTYSYQSVVLYKCLDDPHMCAEVVKREAHSVGIPIIKVIPVDAVVRADVLSVREVVRKLAGKIPHDETFRVTLQGHLEKIEEGLSVELSSDVAVRDIASEIDRPVNLTHPNWVVYVRVIKIGLAKVAAISVLKPSELERVL
ncbi:MAG: THUMP domain-containing protein [Sulfolobales archaeon]|nr:THUMP domain-containing protein [Sulfolobales archaeon]MDW8083162.1 THUMP domain-containing protein [Sulfolobales archaeon]